MILIRPMIRADAAAVDTSAPDSRRRGVMIPAAERTQSQTTPVGLATRVEAAVDATAAGM